MDHLSSTGSLAKLALAATFLASSMVSTLAIAALLSFCVDDFEAARQLDNFPRRLE